MFRQMSNPDLYHGRLPWNKFEGWYFKVCSDEAAFAFIPGIFHGDFKNAPHSFIQIIDGVTPAYDYVRFPADGFKPAAVSFKLEMDGNSFSFSGAKVHVNSNLGRLDAELGFDGVIRWDSSAKSHRSMGYYNFLPFMECYSQVCVMDMDVSGYISLGGKRYEFRNGRGYIEKNWGNQFPISWLWVQCNSFRHARASLSASTGHIPFITGSFNGFLIGFHMQNGFYAFTTMNGSKMEDRNSGRDREIIVQNAKHRLEITTRTSEDAFVLCNAPKDGRMVPFVRETLTAGVQVKLTDRQTGRVLFDDDGYNAGIEYGGKKMDN